MRKLSMSMGLCLLASSSLTLAIDAPSSSKMGNSGFFVGLGGSYNSVNIDQNLYAKGISNVSKNSSLVAYGEAGGPATPYDDSQSTFAPAIQAGYFAHFPDSDLLWGVKASYKYLDATSNNQRVDVPQYGSFTNVGVEPSSTFTGNVVIGSTQNTVKHELTFLPFIGHSFEDSYIYFGAGPALFEVQSKVSNEIGLADINGTHANITGSSASFSTSKWIWGGAAQVGGSYYFAPSWSVDLNYTYAISARHKFNTSGPFSNTYDGYTTTGTLYNSSSQRVITQGVMFSMNKTF